MIFACTCALGCIDRDDRALLQLQRRNPRGSGGFSNGRAAGRVCCSIKTTYAQYYNSYSAMVDRTAVRVLVEPPTQFYSCGIVNQLHTKVQKYFYCVEELYHRVYIVGLLRHSACIYIIYMVRRYIFELK